MTSKNSCDKRKYFRLWDLLPLAVIFIVLVLAGVKFFANSEQESGLTAVITVNSQEYCRVVLSDVDFPYDLSVPVGDDEVVVHITCESACVIESSCPDKLCINTGELTKSGQSAVCLPMRVSVSLVSERGVSEDMPDAIVG